MILDVKCWCFVPGQVSETFLVESVGHTYMHDLWFVEQVRCVDGLQKDFVLRVCDLE